MSKFKFTKTALVALPPAPEGKRVFHYDTEVSGLCVQVTATGTKTFYLYRKVEGKPERIRLGTFPAVTPEQAAREARKALGQIAGGTNPNAERRSARAEWTLAELFADYMEKHAKPHKRSWKGDQDQYRRYLESWGTRRLSNITKASVKALHIRVGTQNGPYAANRMLALLRGVFNFAIRERDLPLANPAVGIKPYAEEEREQRLNSDELPAFFEALAEEPNETARDYILLSLLTGGRKSNVLSMRWDEVHLDRATWEIPAAKFKNGKHMTVHLTRPALELLATRQASKAGPWVFPAASATGHLVEPKSAWARVLQRAQLSDLRLHDLRRTLGSWQADAGASLTIIGKSLGHLSQRTTGIYARLSRDPVSQSMDNAVDAILVAGGVKPTAEVRELKRK